MYILLYYNYKLYHEKSHSIKLWDTLMIILLIYYKKSSSDISLEDTYGPDGNRTRDLLRDRQAW